MNRVRARIILPHKYMISGGQIEIVGDYCMFFILCSKNKQSLEFSIICYEHVLCSSYTVSMLCLLCSSIA